MVVATLLSVDLVESVDLVSVVLVVNCTTYVSPGKKLVFVRIRLYLEFEKDNFETYKIQKGSFGH